MKRIFPLLYLCLASVLPAAEDNPPARPLIDQLNPAEIKTTWEKLTTLITKSGNIDPAEIERARLQGVLQKLGKNARLQVRKAPDQIAVGVDFKQETLPRSILYARLGDLAADNVAQFSAALGKAGKAGAVILDLRATRDDATYEQAARLISLFGGSGQTLFSLVSSDNTGGKNFVGSGDAVFNGIVVVLVNADTCGPAEVVAAVLRQQIHALVVGTKTAGRALDFTALSINPRIDLEIAVGRVVLPGLPGEFLQNGLVPDIVVNTELEQERQILSRSELEGMTPFIFEIERPHMNEASLVAGRNPELDSFQARKAAKTSGRELEPAQILDRSLQRALDSATSLLVLRESANTGG